MSLKCACKAWLWASLNSTATFNLNYRLQYTGSPSRQMAHMHTVLPSPHACTKSCTLAFTALFKLASKQPSAQLTAQCALWYTDGRAPSHGRRILQPSWLGLRPYALLQFLLWWDRDCLIACAHYFP